MDKTDEQVRHRFLLEAEQAVRDANRNIIHERIPKLTKSRVVDFASSVARTRARYLEAAFHVSEMDETGAFDAQTLEDLRLHRETYEETRFAFEALSRAIEQGYVDLEDT